MILDKFKKFLVDFEAMDMFITGPAGTGKTTSLASLIDFCNDEKVNYYVCAYTHKAVNVLLSKLPNAYSIGTLHSFLKKRPVINTQATKTNHLDISIQVSSPDTIHILFIDEFSMVGEKDYLSLTDLQYDVEGNSLMKIVYIGDMNQLPPVKDVQTIVPCNPHWVQLSKIYRQKSTNELTKTLSIITSCLNKNKYQVIPPNKNFIRSVDIIAKYKKDTKDKILLAFTNKRVEELNQLVAGRQDFRPKDQVYSPTTKTNYIVQQFFLNSELLGFHSKSGQYIKSNSKFKDLSKLKHLNVLFVRLLIDKHTNFIHPCVFGHYTYLTKLQKLEIEAVATNKEISKLTEDHPAIWAKANVNNKLAHKRNKAWSKYLTFKQHVICIDFPFAMTIHKAQGSTYRNVYLDIKDLNKCKGMGLKFKLLYVAASRATNKVYTT